MTFLIFALQFLNVCDTILILLKWMKHSNANSTVLDYFTKNEKIKIDSQNTKVGEKYGLMVTGGFQHQSVWCFPEII